MTDELLKGLHKFCEEKSKNIKLKAEPQVFVELADCLDELEMRRRYDEEHRKIGNIEGFNNGYLKAVNDCLDIIEHSFECFISGTTQGCVHWNIEQLKRGGEDGVD